MDPMLGVRSEVGRLRRVLVHEPGLEVDRMVPAMMEELLFDDILDGDRAREEHARFRRLLQFLGIEVLEARGLLREALEHDEARKWLVGLLEDEVPFSLRDQLRGADAGLLTRYLVEGVRRGPDPRGVEIEELFELPPLPNWCFQRDPQIVLGDSVIFSSMATPARYREALLARAIFRFHSACAGTEILLDPLAAEPDRPLFLGLERPRIEGGDLLILSPEVVVIGESQRTNPVGIHRLARALARREDGPRTLLVVEIPRRRAYMHLDTLFTMVDRDACLMHAPVMSDGGLEQAEVFEFDLHAPKPRPVPQGGFFSVLHRKGIDLEPIPCGGDDILIQQREQWTDGANCLALAPGVITLYDRNRGTAAELSKRGFEILRAEDLLLGRSELDLDRPRRTCILLPSNEISRARGGPHCLSHPLLRDEV
jgi:arginine deiminase